MQDHQAAITTNDNPPPHTSLFKMTTINPMMIPHVAEVIFQHCDYNDLKAVRLTCREWCTYSFKTFVSRSRVHLRDFRELNAFIDEATGRKLGASSDAATASCSTLLDLCSHVRLSGLEFQSYTILLRPFFKTFSGHLRSLEIDHGHVSHSPFGMEVFMRELAQSGVSNLEELILSGSHLSYQPHEPFSEFSVSLPSIKTLKVILSTYSPPHNGFKFFQQVLSTLPNVENLTCINYPFLSLYSCEPIEAPRHLKKLHLHLWNGCGIREFIDRRYQITHLKISIERSLSLINLHSLVQSFSHCLESLQLKFATTGGGEVYNYSHNASSFPGASQLKSLRYLGLVGYWGSLYFLKDIPKLERVDVESMQWSIAFPDGTQDEELIPVKTRKVIRFFNETGIYHEV